MIMGPGRLNITVVKERVHILDDNMAATVINQD